MKKPTSARPQSSTPSVKPADSGFAYTRAFFETRVDAALAHAKKLGASDAGAEVSEGCGLSVSVRNGELENVERNRDKSLGVTVYLGNRRGNASTSDFSDAAIEQTVRAAYDIARFTAEDPFASLPDADDIVPVSERERELDLFFPWAVTSEQAAALALECEAAALGVSKRITNSEGAAVSAQQSHFFSAHTRGFRGGYASSRHSYSVSPIAGKGKDMQRDAWFSSMRSADELASPQAVGRYAAERALSRLKARKIATVECPVLFESPLAAGLLGAFVQAVSGGSLYRKSSFLLDSLGKQVFPKHIDILEDPHVLRGKGSWHLHPVALIFPKAITGLATVLKADKSHVFPQMTRIAYRCWIDSETKSRQIHAMCIESNPRFQICQNWHTQGGACKFRTSSSFWK